MSKKNKVTVTLAESDYLLIESIRRYCGLNTIKSAVRRCIINTYDDIKDHKYFKKAYSEVSEEIKEAENEQAGSNREN